MPAAEVRLATEVIVVAVTGSMTAIAPGTLLLGGYAVEGRQRCTGRTTPVPTGPHSWAGRRFSAGWNTRQMLHVTLVEPERSARERLGS
ncbi:hypothetical protein [Streptomyces lydicus]|uniref:hypothetical protein n=1 Tax=Streptomyces lydicus TaxID=47763 RepID=UPI003719119C